MTNLSVNGVRVNPNTRQRLGMWIINRGANLIRKAAPESVDLDLETPRDRMVREAFEDLLASIWLYIDWRYVTRQLTTEQKNLFADSIDRAHDRMDAEEGRDLERDPRIGVDRWWNE